MPPTRISLSFPLHSLAQFIVQIIEIKRLRHRARLHHRNIIHARERIRQHGLHHRSREPLGRRKSKARRSDFLPVALAEADDQDGALRGHGGNAFLGRLVAAEVEVLEREGLVGRRGGEARGRAGGELDAAAGEDGVLGGVRPDAADEVQGEGDGDPGVEC